MNGDVVIVDQIRADLLQLIEERCGLAPGSASGAADLYRDLGMDSLDLLAIAQAMQVKYSISLDNEGIAAALITLRPPVMSMIAYGRPPGPESSRSSSSFTIR